MSDTVSDTVSDTMSVARDLWDWLPYLLGGFGWNLLVAASAMALGTVAGALVARLALARGAWPRRLAAGITAVTRNAPTIVFQFYLAMMIPSAWGVPAWLKASIALALAVTGFTADNLAIALREWRAGRHGAAFLFVPAWATYLVIIVIASSTASLIGVPELVSRCNGLITASGRTDLMVPVYLFAAVLFFATCWPLATLLSRLRQRLARRYAGA